ncbi:MAG: serine/threonine-protein kinase [bacterium]
MSEGGNAVQCPSCRIEQPESASYCSACGFGLASLHDAGNTLGASSLPASAVEVQDSTLEFPAAAMLREGMVFAGRYEIQAIIGRGGMGTVYRARDRHLEEVVALKLILPQLVPMGGILDRFKHETRLARQLSHPNIIKVYDLGQHEDVTYLSMEYLEGTDLRHVIADEGPLPIPRAIEIARQICAGLAFAHESGVIHRDIKPHNIFLNKRGRVKLLDFGLAKAIDVSQVSLSGQAIGTPAYMSPEQAVAQDGQPVDHRTDLYSLGVVLFQLFTGQVPFRGTSAIEVALAHVQRQPPRPRELRPDIPQHIEAIVLKAMAKDRDYRYSSALEIASDLSGETRHWESAAKVSGHTQPVEHGRAEPRQGPALDTSRHASPASEWAPVLGERDRGDTRAATGRAERAGHAGWLVPVVMVVAIAVALGAYRMRTGPLASSSKPIASAPSPTTAAPEPSQDSASVTAPGPAQPSTAPAATSAPAPSPTSPTTAATATTAKPATPPSTAPPRAASSVESAAPSPASPASPPPRIENPAPPRAAPATSSPAESGPKGATTTAASKATVPPAPPETKVARVEPERAPPEAKTVLPPVVPNAATTKTPPPLPKGKLTELDLRRQACDGGDGEVCHDLGALFQEGDAGLGANADATQAASYYRRSCELGVGEGCIDGGMLLVEEGDAAGAARLYEAGCRLHKPQSCFNLAKMVKAGDGVDPDPGRAALLHREACEGGLAAGCTSLGLLYENGEGVERNPKLALDLYKRGCDGGSVPGCSNLGSLYQGGNGVDQDFAKAGEYYDRACQKGLSTACFNLGRLAEQGLGREADPSAAIALYKKACGKGNENACAAAHRLATP